MITELTADSFESQVLKAEGFVLVYLYAPWCSSCENTAPIVDELSDEYHRDEVIFYKIDTDKNPELAGSLGIRAIPAVLLFRGGTAPARMLGRFTRPQLVNFLNQHT